MKLLEVLFPDDNLPHSRSRVGDCRLLRVRGPGGRAEHTHVPNWSQSIAAHFRQFGRFRNKHPVIGYFRQAAQAIAGNER